MKKYLFVIMLVLGNLFVSGQDLPADIRFMIEAKQFDKAKDALDKFNADPKNAANAMGWYYKAFVNNALARDPKKTVAESKALNDEAFVTLKKYTELDPKVPLTKEESNSTLYNIYFSYYDLAAKLYNEKNYADSYDYFKSSLDVHDYGVARNLNGPGTLKFAVHDTDLVWNLAVLANELKKKDDAMIYYKKIADADLKDEKYVTAYEEMILKYKREKNVELFNKYVASAKKHYPIDIPYWEMKEIDFALTDLENEALLNKYEELTKTHPNNYVVFYNYAIEIDRFISGDAAKGKDANAINAYRLKIEEMYKKAISVKSTLEGNLQLANLYYSKTFDLQERIAKIKGTKPAEVKVKNDLIAESKALSLATIPYAEEAVRILGTYKEYKFADKSNYKLALEILGHGYKISGNAAKLAEVEKKKLEVDKL